MVYPPQMESRIGPRIMCTASYCGREAAFHILHIVEVQIARVPLNCCLRTEWRLYGYDRNNLAGDPPRSGHRKTIDCTHGSTVLSHGGPRFRRLRTLPENCCLHMRDCLAYLGPSRSHLSLVFLYLRGPRIVMDLLEGLRLYETTGYSPSLDPPRCYRFLSC